MKNETINKVLIFSGENEKIDVLKKVKFIFSIMNYAGVSDEQLEKILNSKISILSKEDIEIIKAACILNKTGLIDEIFCKNSILKNALNYKRIFMRHFVAEKSGRYLNKSSILFLTEPDKEAYGSCLFDRDVIKILNVSISSDEELERELNNHMSYNNNMPITVDKCINLLSIRFLNKYKESQTKKNDRSI